MRCGGSTRRSRCPRATRADAASDVLAGDPADRIVPNASSSRCAGSSATSCGADRVARQAAVAEDVRRLGGDDVRRVAHDESEALAAPPARRSCRHGTRRSSMPFSAVLNAAKASARSFTSVATTRSACGAVSSAWIPLRSRRRAPSRRHVGRSGSTSVADGRGRPARAPAPPRRARPTRSADRRAGRCARRAEQAVLLRWRGRDRRAPAVPVRERPVDVADGDRQVEHEQADERRDRGGAVREPSVVDGDVLKLCESSSASARSAYRTAGAGEPGRVERGAKPATSSKRPDGGAGGAEAAARPRRYPDPALHADPMRTVDLAVRCVVLEVDLREVEADVLGRTIVTRRRALELDARDEHVDPARSSGRPSTHRSASPPRPSAHRAGTCAMCLPGRAFLEQRLRDDLSVGFVMCRSWNEALPAPPPPPLARCRSGLRPRRTSRSRSSPRLSVLNLAVDPRRA